MRSLLLALVLAAPAVQAQSAGRGELPVLARPAALNPRTRAERTGYRETSTYDDVRAFLDSIITPGGPLVLDSLGRTHEGRLLPLVIASRPAVRTPAEARKLGRAIAYVQANIHAGEVEGKEAMQALLRELAQPGGRNLLDSIVLVVVPIYNADGNERFADQALNRYEQNGPESVGQRPNAQSLDLNRDYVKAEAPETRAFHAAVNKWDPDLFMDLHTTDGSFHGYALTWSPSLHPSSPLTPYVRDTLLPAITAKLEKRTGIKTFAYGNFSNGYGEGVNTDTVKQGWYTYDHRPRFGTNYMGLRNRVSILAEAYSHDPFARRVEAMHEFVREALGAFAANAKSIVARGAAADRAIAKGGSYALQAELTKAGRMLPVISEDLLKDSSGVRSQPGVPMGLRRSGHFRTQVMPVYDRFEGTLVAPLPAGWLVDARDTAIVAALRLHDVTVSRLTKETKLPTLVFTIDSVVHAARPFQGHRETRLVGHAAPSTTETIPAGTYWVSGRQRMARVAVLLLGPRSDDGLVNWNQLDDRLAVSQAYPVRASSAAPAVPLSPVP
jgi:hypothetical protein